tara:strand:+ start:4422 stop:5435 length:1014 start_codon:yes stop_codon:yes gene_type:complete
VLFFIKRLLLPAAFIYSLILKLRHCLFNAGIIKSYQFKTPIIGIGNLSFGGTGKSPLVIYLTKLLQSKGKTVAIVSRGYGRKTKGVVHCNASHTAIEIGDEPKMYLSELDNTQIVVAERRKEGISFLLQSDDKPDVILLDDCFQHRYITPSVLLLLTTEKKPYWKDFLVPAGYLRDIKSAASRADALVITKTTGDYSALQKPKEWDSKHTFSSKIVYQTPVNEHGQEIGSNEVISFTGLANSALFEKHLKENYSLKKNFKFADHHYFTDTELEKIIQFGKGNSTQPNYMTTLKDFSRLSDSQRKLFGQNLFTIKISTPILEEKELIRFLTNKNILQD